MDIYNKKLSIGISMLVAFLIIGSVFVYYTRDQSMKPLVKGEMGIDSPDFVNGGMIPEKFSCIGDNISPNITITNIPPKTKSLALVIYDASMPVPFLHWMVINMAPNTTVIPENTSPQNAVVGLNDYGKGQYDGPCPPQGSTHKYIIRVYALDMDLGVRNSLSLEAMEKSAKRNELDYAEYVGYFTR